MATGIAGDLRAIFEGGAVAGLTDGQLLERFASTRPEEAEPAFAALVARHGSMVLSVCRSRLRDAHDAEDAFQATFLTLARKAGSLRRPESLAPWLHGVALRTARRLSDHNARRRRHEAEASMLRSSFSGPSDRRGDAASARDDISALHEEIDRLPERYRTAIVLCDLEGRTHQEAGRLLGRPVGTISARLSRARERLRVRLIRRGFALSAAAMGAATIPARASGPPAALVCSTTRIAMAVSAGAMAASVPPAIAALSREVSRAGLVAKLAMISAIVLALGAGAAGVALIGPQQGPGPNKPGPAVVGRSALPPAAPDDPLPAGAKLRLGTSRFRPPSIVVDMALSPDERTIVTVGDELIAWDAATGKERWRALARDYGYRPQAACYGQRALAFAPDGMRFFTPGKPGEILAWETSSGRRETLKVAPPRRFFSFSSEQGGARSIDVAPDGQSIACGYDTGLTVCDRRGKVLYGIGNVPLGPRALDNQDRLTFGSDYAFARFSPDGKELALVKSDRPQEIRLHEAGTGRELRKIMLSARLVRMAFSPDGRRLATTERDSAVRLYDVGTGRPVWSRVLPLDNPRENYTSALAFSPDGKIIAACATDYRIYLIDAASGGETGRLVGHRWYPWALAFTADGKMLYSSGWDPAIRRWDVAARKQLDVPGGVHATAVVAASPDGRTLAYEDDSGAIRLVDAASGAERRTLALPGAQYSQLTFSADGRLLAGGGEIGDQVHVAVWDAPGGRLLHRWDWPKGRDPHSSVETLAFAPDGSRLAAAVFRQSSAYLWDLATGRQIARLAHDHVYGVSFSPDHRTLATAGWDSTVRFWATEDGDLRREFKVPKQGKDDDLRMFTVLYAPDGGSIATAHLDGKVRIWQAVDMVLRTAFRAPSWFRESTMSYSPDGLWLATGVAGGRVDAWDASTGQNVWDRGRHRSDVYVVGFGRDGRTLVSGGQDGACYLWDLRPTDLPPGVDPARLWDDLAGDDGPAAFRAMWALSAMPDRAVTLLSEKLGPVKNVGDLDHVDPGILAEEVQKRRRMRAILIRKDPKLESALAVRRAISLLTWIGSPDAIAVLNDLAKRDPKGDLGRFAAAALDRLSVPAGP